MIEVSEESSIAARISQLAHAARTLMGTISESRANYLASYVTDYTCPVLFFYLGLHHGTSRPAIVLGVFAGLMAFTLIEYSIHRWLLHNPKSVLFPLHAAHHNHPETPSAFLFPTSLVVLGTVWLLFAKGLHLPSSAFFIAGVAAGYCYFGTVHHVEHSTRINQLPFRWMQKRWAAHSVHHHFDTNNYGVITSFWDYVFGTHQKQHKRRQMQG
jgi:sterol desaturase/sphingolipid hydroxylase (fatty acid hydroxylase superfamily)